MVARKPRSGAPRPPGPNVPVYVISVAAELTGLHPQTLRQYDRVGLVSPGRTGGGGRRYSLHDIETLRLVADLTAVGIGLEGVRRILELENTVAALRGRNEELLREMERLRQIADLATSALLEQRSKLPVLRRGTTISRIDPDR
ncbi:MAG: MerR family transcriptional regulator [Nocardioidaceae bacterium]